MKFVVVLVEKGWIVQCWL